MEGWVILTLSLIAVALAVSVVRLRRQGRSIALGDEHHSNGEGTDQPSQPTEADLAQLRREELLNLREERLNRIETTLGEREDHLAQAEASLRLREANAVDSERARIEALAGVAELTPEAARAELMARVEKEAHRSAAQLSREIELAAKAEAEQRARRTVVTSIQRLAAELTNDSSVAVVALPGEEMKGRIIGKEGRNVRSFEQITGANLLIDDTPGTVLVSCFDPLRREVARLTLVELITDGRIHPGRIEEAYLRTTAATEQLCTGAAEDALLEMGISDLNPELLPVLGALRFRTSYGQNVLAHLVECGHIAALMAAELGLDVAMCRRAAFLHDLGKAVTNTSLSHALAGADLARRHGEHPDIVHAIEAHHNEVEPATVEAVLTQAADAISGSRPGARRESVELYVKRLERLEQIALAHLGVEKVLAMQAGREVRVMVSPQQLSDAEAAGLAHTIAKQVEAELTYPGNIKVTVVRESRASAVAH